MSKRNGSTRKKTSIEDRIAKLEVTKKKLELMKQIRDLREQSRGLTKKA